MVIINALYAAALCCLLSWAHAARTDCVPGTFFNGRSCEPCPSGTYQYESGQTSCNLCPPGTYYPFTNGPGVDVCISCPKNTFNDKAGAISRSSCKPCPSGQISSENSSHCLSCPAGTEVNVCPRNRYILGGLCFGCDRGIDCYGSLPEPRCWECPYQYASKRNSHSCTKCPMNSYTLSGSPKCNICPKQGCQRCDEFMVYDPTTVVDQPFGYDDTERTSGCTPCPAGFVGNRYSNSVRCVRCAPGTFKKEGYIGRCERCRTDPEGIRSGSSCAECSRKQKFNPELQICEACPSGQISLGGKATKCKRCPRGSTPTQEGCKCLPGWEPTGPGRCRICPPGSQGPLPYRRRCSKCFSRTIAPKAGTPGGECQICPNGTEPNRRRTRCIPISVSCPAGFYLIHKTCYSHVTNCPQGQTRTNERSESGLEDFICS